MYAEQKIREIKRQLSVRLVWKQVGIKKKKKKIRVWENLGRKTWTRLKKLCGSDFRSLGESDDYMPTLILRIVLVLKIESLLYVYFFCPSTYVLIMGEFGMKDLDRVEEVMRQ